MRSTKCLTKQDVTAKTLEISGEVRSPFLAPNLLVFQGILQFGHLGFGAKSDKDRTRKSDKLRAWDRPLTGAQWASQNAIRMAQ